MAWITPKTDWVATDRVNANDFNRIAGNLNELKRILELPIESIDNNKSISSLPYPKVWNEVEDVLDEINQLAFNLDIGEKKTYLVNQPYIDWQELNRIESFTLKLYYQYYVQKNTTRHFAYRMGESKYRAVPRVHYVKHEPEYRLSFRLGAAKGVKL